MQFDLANLDIEGLNSLFPERPKRNPIAAGLSSGVDSLQGLGYSALGGVSDAVGLDSARDWLNEQAARNALEAQQNGRPDLERIEDQSLGTALPYAAYQISKQVPLMGSIMAANLIPGVGQAATATGLARLGAVAPKVIGGGGLQAGANFAARRAALQAGEALASEALMGTALGYGSLYGESVEGGDPSPFASAALAPFYGLAEAAVPAAVRGALRAPVDIAGNLGTRMLKAGGLGALGESSTELVQNEMEMALNGGVSPEEAFSRRINSAVAGGIVGGPLGSLGGIRKPMAPTLDDQSKPTNLLGLGYEGNRGVGTYQVFPDGSVALNGDQELAYRYNRPDQLTLQPYGPTDGPLAGAAQSIDLETLRSDLGELAAMAEVAQRSGDAAQLEALNAAMRQTFDQIKALETQGTAGQSELFFPNGAPTYGADAGLPNLTTQLDPLQQRIDQNLGLTRQGAPRNYPQQFQAAASEPTNLFAQDPATGREIRLDMGQASQIRAGDNVQLTPEQIRAQEVGAAAAQEKQAIEGRKERTAAAGLDPKKVQHVQAWSYIEEALDNGVIDQPEAARLAANVASGIDKVGGIQKYLTGLAATKQAIADGKAQETQAALDKVQKQPTNGTPTTQAKQAAPKGPQAAAAAAPAADPAADVLKKYDALTESQKSALSKSVGIQRADNQLVSAILDNPEQFSSAIDALTTQAPAATAQAPVAGIDANKTVAVGRKGREKDVTAQQLVTLMGNAAPLEKARIAAAVGFEATVDPTTGAPKLVQIGEPQTLEAIASAESRATGKKVTKEAIRLSLLKFGITPEVIDRVQAVAVDTVSTEELAINPEENGSGFRVETQASKATGQGLIDDGVGETKKQREARAQADEILKAAGPSTALAAADDRPTNLPEGAVVTDLRENNPSLIEANTQAILNHPLAAEAALYWDHDTISYDQLPPKLKAEWVEDYLDNRRINEGDLNEDELTAAEDRIGRTYEQFFAPVAVPAVESAAKPRAISGGNAGAGSRSGMVEGAEAERPQLSDQSSGSRDAEKVTDVDARQVTTETEDRPATPFVPRGVAVEAAAEEKPTTPFTSQLKSALNNTEGLTLSKDQTTEVEIDDLLYAEGFADAQQTLDTLGIGNASDWVSEWRTHDQIGDEYADGWLELVGSRYVLTLKDPAAKSKTDSHLTFTHEVGHAVDMAPHGGVYSAQPELAMRMVDGNLMADGEVAQELQSLYDPADPFWGMLEYPLDSTAELIPDAETAQRELFAQAFSLFTHPVAARKLKADAPLTYQFLTEVAYDIQRSKPRQIQTAVQAAQRRSQFAKRNGAAAQSNGVLGQAGQGGGTSPQPGVPGRTRFARTSQTLKGLDKPAYMSKAPSELWETAQGAMAWLKDWTFTRGAFTRDLLNKAAELMPAAKTYLDEMQRARVESVKLEREVASIVDDASALAAHERGTGPRSINALIRRMTYENKWAFAPEWVKNVKPDAELAEWFDGLSKEAQAVVKRVFKHGHDSLLAAQRAAIDSIESEVNPLIDAARAKGDLETVKELEKAKVQADGKFRRLIEIRGQTPYAPLRRFGNWAVVVKSKMYQDAQARGDEAEMDRLSRDGNHYRVEFKSNQLSATARAKALQQELGDVSVQAFERGDDALLYGGESMFKAFSRFRNLAREKIGAVDPSGKQTKAEAEVTTALDKTLASMYMALVAETSARTSEFERKNVAGADMDMMRAFATQGRAMANFIGSLKTSGKIMDTLRTMKKQTYSGTNQAEKSKLYNEILRRHAMGLNYEPNQLLDKSLAANSYWSLITSPSYLLTNLTQPWVVSVPVLAGKFGLGRSSSEMMRAYKEIGRIATKLVDNPDAVKDLPKDVQAVVSELFNRGSIDISLGADLGSFTSGGESELSARTQKILRLPRTLAERGEMVNRVATAVAAYRLAKAQKMSTEDAIDYADKVIYETHGDYSAFNAPRVMRNPVGRFATQFRKFQLIQIALYGRLIKDATKSLDPKERKAAQQALLYTLGTTFTLGGLTAMPGYTAISFLAGSVLGLGDDDEPDDPVATTRRMLGGGPEADLILGGIPNLMGLNIGNRIGAAGMLSILPYTDLEASRDGYKDILLGLAGPFFGGTLPKALDGVGLISNGDYWKGLELLMPRGVADAMRGIRFAAEGVSKRNGDVTLSADEINFFEMALQAVGLPPKDITDNQMLRNSQFKADEFYKDRTSQLKRQYVEAYRDGDGATMQEVRQSWMETQDARRRLGIKVQPLSELLKAPQEQRKRESRLQEESLLLG